jgi:hypothetical protein
MSKTVQAIGEFVAGSALLAAGLVLQNPMLDALGVTTMLAGVGVALRPKPPGIGGQAAISFSQGPAPRRVGYGQIQTAGVLTYASFPPSSNLNNDLQYLHLVYTLYGHEISSFDAVFVNGTVRNFGTDIVYVPGGVSTGSGSTPGCWHVWPLSSSSLLDIYWQHMFFEFDFGRPLNSSPPFPNLEGDSTWNSACLQRGCAKVHVMLQYDARQPSIFYNGQIPNIQFLVTGKKIIDPRIITAWQPSTGYVEYNYLVDNRGILWVQTNASGTSGAVGSRPNFEGSVGFPATLADNTCSWTTGPGSSMTTASAGADFAPQGHVVNARLVNDAWVPGDGWLVGQIIEAPLGYLQMSTFFGAAGASEPAFALTVGGATADGTQSWVCLGRSWHAINPSNSALVVNDYLQDTDYGMGAPLSTIDIGSVIAAANVCEEQELIIWNADNSVVYENEYSCDGMFEFSSTRGDVLSSLLASMAGWAIPPGDLWHVFAGSFQTATIALGDTDMRGPVKGDFRLSVRDLLNTVGADYVPAFLPSNPAGANSLDQVPPVWQARGAPEYQANGLAGKPDYLNSEDGGQVLRAKLKLDFTTSLWTAQRLEKIELMRTRFPQTLSLPAKSMALQIAAGDSFAFSHLHWGIDDQIFMASQRSVIFESEGGSGKDSAPIVGVNLIARQIDPSIYEFQGPTSASDFGEYSPYGITGVMTGVE